MKRSARLEKIANINLGFENLAGADLATARTQYQAQENQLKQLKLYKEEYQRQLTERLKGTISATEIQDYQYFFASLDNAIAQQTEIVKQSAEQLDASRNNWLDKKQDVAKMSRVAETVKSQEAAAELGREQKENDERNLRMFAAGNNQHIPH